MFSGLLPLLIVACVTCRASGFGHIGFGSEEWWTVESDTSDHCTDCYEYCLITDKDGKTHGGCTCPEDFNCTFVYKKPRYTSNSWWNPVFQLMSHSKCLRYQGEPHHYGPPCLVTRDDDVYDLGCGEGFTCDVGPITSVTGYSVSYCNYASDTDVDRFPWWTWFCQDDVGMWKNWCYDEPGWKANHARYWRRKYCKKNSKEPKIPKGKGQGKGKGKAKGKGTGRR